MSHTPPPKRPTRPNGQTKIPGRLYTFTVTLLATLIAGITLFAFQLANTDHSNERNHSSTNLLGTTTTLAVGVTNNSNASRPAVRRITRNQLKKLGGISLGLAILSLIPSRKSEDESSGLTSQTVSQIAGLPVLGSLFANTKSPSRRAGRGRLVRVIVSTFEMSLCVAFMLTLAACFSKPELFAALSQDPLAGYTAAVGHLSGIVQGWMHPGVALT